jgi:hypothetical protein
MQTVVRSVLPAPSPVALLLMGDGQRLGVCGCAQSMVSGAWEKLQAACGGRPINNFHESCKSFFPARLPLRGSLVEVLIGESPHQTSWAHLPSILDRLTSLLSKTNRSA